LSASYSSWFSAQFFTAFWRFQYFFKNKKNQLCRWARLVMDKQELAVLAKPNHAYF